MSHQRIIGIIILLCIILLFIPILKTTKLSKTSTQEPKILFPSYTVDKDVAEIVLDNNQVVPPDTPNNVTEESNLQAPELPPLTPNTVTNNTGKWVVQIASIKATNIISLTDLKLALKRANYKTITENTTINGTKWVRFYSSPFAEKTSAEKFKHAINQSLKKYHIQAIVKQK